MKYIPGKSIKNNIYYQIYIKQFSWVYSSFHVKNNLKMCNIAKKITDFWHNSEALVSINDNSYTLLYFSF